MVLESRDVEQSFSGLTLPWGVNISKVDALVFLLRKE